MVSFNYIIKEKSGLHARPAGMLSMKCKSLDSSIKVKCENKEADGKRLLSLMSLGAKCGQTLEFTIEGKDEIKAETEIKAFLEENI